jgi:flavin reductase (DIM6/NTAB) family NADH-FMN oxidoreductase RutF
MKTDASLEHYYHYAFPMQTVLVTCNDETGKTNIITLAWHTPLSRVPPLYGISLSPKRYSHRLIEKTKEFVVNFIPYSLVKAADYCGTHTGRSTDKVHQTKLTLTPAKKLVVPRIKEGYAHLECTLAKRIHVGDHTLFIGEVVAVSADKNVFKDDLLRTENVSPLYYIGENSYTTLDRRKRKNL